MVAVQGNLDFVVTGVGALVSGRDSHVAFDTGQLGGQLTAGIGISAGDGGFCHYQLLDLDSQGLGRALEVLGICYGVDDGIGTRVHQIVSSLIADNIAKVGGCSGQRHGFAVGDGDRGSIHRDYRLCLGDGDFNGIYISICVVCVTNDLVVHRVLASSGALGNGGAPCLIVGAVLHFAACGFTAVDQILCHTGVGQIIGGGVSGYGCRNLADGDRNGLCQLYAAVIVVVCILGSINNHIAIVLHGRNDAAVLPCEGAVFILAGQSAVRQLLAVGQLRSSRPNNSGSCCLGDGQLRTDKVDDVIAVCQRSNSDVIRTNVGGLGCCGCQRTG